MKAGEFTKLQLKEYPKSQERESSESRYWKAFNNVRETTLDSSPNCIHFNPVDPSAYIVTASIRISQFDGLTDKIQRSYSRFQDDAFSGKYRKDGKLIVAGDKSGYVKVFDVQSKSMLRQMKQHQAAVRTTTWTADGLHVISGSDDKKILVSDLATEEIVWSSKNHHSDYVRAIDYHSSSPAIFASGSYDHSVAMWDYRQSQPVWNVDHGKPVEYCLFAPSGNIVITAGGNEIKMWDVLNGGRLMHSFSNHNKNITSLCMDSSSSRLLSAGLDGHVKVYSLQTLEMVHGMSYGSPLLSLGLSSESKKLVLGFVNGNVMVRNRKDKENIKSDNAEDESEIDVLEQMERQLSQSRFLKTADKVHEYHHTVVLETDRGDHLQLYELHLKKFNYQKALDAAIATKNPVIVVTVLEELCRRNGLTIALSGRDEITLEPIVSFVGRYFNHPRYASIVVQVAHKLIDIYASIVGFSEIIDELFAKLRREVHSEVAFQKDAMRIIGSIECITNVSSLVKRKRHAVEEVGENKFNSNSDVTELKNI